jgi:hypothetical protein
MLKKSKMMYPSLPRVSSNSDKILLVPEPGELYHHFLLLLASFQVEEVDEVVHQVEEVVLHLKDWHL